MLIQRRIHAEFFHQIRQRSVPFDLSMVQSRIFQIPRSLFHDMDIASASACHRTQKISRHDHICRRSADSSRSRRRDPAGAVGAQPAADAFQTKTAFDALSLHSVMRCLHGKPRNKALQRLVCTLTGFTAITLVHTFFLLMMYIFKNYKNNSTLSAEKHPSHL